MTENPYEAPVAEDVPAIAEDIVEKVKLDFPAEAVADVLKELAKASQCQRVRRCIVFAARGHAWYFRCLCQLDYRDAISAAEYSRYSDRLYDLSKPIDQAKIDDPRGGYSETH